MMDRVSGKLSDIYLNHAITFLLKGIEREVKLAFKMNEVPENVIQIMEALTERASDLDADMKKFIEIIDVELGKL